MKRTINISEKHRDMLESYELNYDKDEFNLLITKLLKANHKLKKRSIDILVISELICDYNIDFFTLMNCLSQSRVETPNNIINAEDLPIDGPLLITKSKKDEDQKEKKVKLNEEHKKVIEEVCVTEINNMNIEKEEGLNQTTREDDISFVNVFAAKKKENELKKHEKNNEEKSLSNPILALGIDLR